MGKGSRGVDLGGGYSQHMTELASSQLYSKLDYLGRAGWTLAEGGAASGFCGGPGGTRGIREASYPEASILGGRYSWF